MLHRDIKPGNLFLDSSNNVKLGDFGLSRIMGKESLYAYTNVGTPYYMSPEQINEQKYDEKSDIWSTGCILYEIAALRPPFEATTQMALACKIKDGKYNRLPKIYSEELWRVITLMLAPNQEKRPAVEDLLNIPQISLRLRENRLKSSFAKLKKREEDMKAKELKFVDLENQLLKLKEELKQKATELESKDKQLKDKEEELENMKTKFEEKQKEGTPPLVMSETPKIYGERAGVFNDNKRLYRDSSSSVYNSLKQEIKELTSQVSYDATKEKDNQKSSLSLKSKLGYKSVERRRRGHEDGLNVKKTYDYTKDSMSRLYGNDDKENIPLRSNYTNSSADAFHSFKEAYTTPPFKSYKSKIPDNGKERVQTTSYRSRSKAYNDSNRSSLNMYQRKSKDRKPFSSKVDV